MSVDKTLLSYLNLPTNSVTSTTLVMATKEIHCIEHFMISFVDCTTMITPLVNSSGRSRGDSGGLIGLILYIPVNNLSFMSEGVFQMGLAQEQNVRLEHDTPRTYL